jgi:membrane protein DedA with SNARE-associated domain
LVVVAVRLERLTVPVAICALVLPACAPAAQLHGAGTERAVERAAARANPYLERWGYIAVFATVAIEAIGIPAPGHTMLVAASLAAARGTLNIRLVLLAGAVGTLLGSHVGWIIGRLAGDVLRRRSRFVMDHLAKTERTFARWGRLVVVFGPFVEGIRQLNALAADALAMPWPRFALCNFAGTALWIGVWGAGTWLLVENIDSVFAVAERVRPWLLGLTAASVAFAFALLVLKRPQHA